MGDSGKFEEFDKSKIKLGMQNKNDNDNYIKNGSD